VEVEAACLGAKVASALGKGHVADAAEPHGALSPPRSERGTSADRSAVAGGQRRLVAGQYIGRVVAGRTVVGHDSLLDQRGAHSRVDPLHDALDIVVGRAAYTLEARSGAVGVDVEHAVEADRMEVWREPELAGEALDHGDRAPLSSRHVGSSSIPGANLICEHAHDHAQDLRVVRRPIAQLIGQRQHPLPVRDVRQDVVDEVRRRCGHEPSATRRTEAPTTA